MSGILGQLDPAAGAFEDLYACPAKTVATVKVIISNRASASTFRILVAINGAASEVKQELASDTPIAANEPGSTVSFVISDGDVIRVRSASGNVSFSATGETRAQ